MRLNLFVIILNRIVLGMRKPRLPRWFLIQPRKRFLLCEAIHARVGQSDSNCKASVNFHDRVLNLFIGCFHYYFFTHSMPQKRCPKRRSMRNNAFLRIGFARAENLVDKYFVAALERYSMPDLYNIR